MYLDGFLVILAICTGTYVQAQQYIVEHPFHYQQPQDDFYRNRNIRFQPQYSGFSGLNQFIPQTDLQTSDIPFHLQKTLPQYRFQNKNEAQSHTIIFRPDHERSSTQNVAPSTHRPNYSHFLLKNHVKHPAESETFLGQITLDDSSSPNWNKDFYDFPENHKPIQSSKLLKHTRILAPDPEQKQSQLRENKYFVNENGEVYSSSEIPPRSIFSSKKLTTKIEIEKENPKELSRSNFVEKASNSPKPQDQIGNSANNFDLKDYEYEDEEIETPSNTKNLIEPNEQLNNFNEENKAENDEEPIVSVVTTKSVINNTIIATSAPEVSSTTESSSSENTTDSWVVVASVQTSKSISGAHYLPSSIVAQEERLTVLNEKERREKLNEEMTTIDNYNYEDDGELETTTEYSTILPAPNIKFSTESLIDKLDRVQSDLSSGLLTGRYKGEGNNIAVITENMTDKIQIAEMTEPPTIILQHERPTSPKPHSPLIKKFSPNSRPSTSNLYTKKKPTKLPVISSTTINLKKGEAKILIAKPDALLPPGYQQPTEEKDNNSSELLSELLKKLKNATGENELNSNRTENNSETQSHHRFGNVKTSTENNTKNSENVTKSYDLTNLLPPGYKTGSKNESNSSLIENLLKRTNKVDLSSLLPPGFKKQSSTTTNKPSTSSIDSILENSKKDDISAFLPPGYKHQTSATKKTSNIDSILQNSKEDDIGAFLPPGYKSSTTPKSKLKIEDVLKQSQVDDISAFLPPGYKSSTTPETKLKIDDLLEESKKDDINAFNKFKPSSTSKPKKKIEDLLEQSKKDDIGAFLPPGFKKTFTTRKPTSVKTKIEVENLPTSLLPSGYKPRKGLDKIPASTEPTTSTTTVPTSSTTTGKGLKVVFPSRPGGKRVNHRITTPKSKDERKEVTQSSAPTIHKGWPVRVTTEFTGWPTPSTTPISIEKLLESLQRSSPMSVEPENITIVTTTQTIVTTTTTTPRPTTPGFCVEECDLVGTIKLVDGVKWVPELLDRNTKEWQLLANEVQTQLEEVFKKSDRLDKLFTNLRIDGFSEGSVLVDYLVEMDNINRRMSTLEIKKLFNAALERSIVKSTVREGKSLNETIKMEEKTTLGKFIIDPNYTDFIVVPKQRAPMVGYAEDNLLLPQWAIAVIVIGLASLLFVIIFGVTVLVNRSKNAKKKVPTPLTDDMLHELNKNHMSNNSYDNYGLEDPYGMEVGFWDTRRMDAQREYNKMPKKGSSGSVHDNSMTNLYDSWKSQWNGHYNNSANGYYGHAGPGNSHRFHERRRSYDTNF